MEKRYGYITPDDFKTAALNNITEKSVRARVNNQGWDIDRAITEPLRNLQRAIWHDYKEIAEQNNITRGAFDYRVKKMGWSPERAASTAENQLPTRRVIPLEIVEKAAANGISYTCLYQRLNKRKMSIEEAITLPPVKREDAYKYRKNNAFTDINNAYGKSRELEKADRSSKSKVGELA